jgi:hypothetical protein
MHLLLDGREKCGRSGAVATLSKSGQNVSEDLATPQSNVGEGLPQVVHAYDPFGFLSMGVRHNGEGRMSCEHLYDEVDPGRMFGRSQVLRLLERKAAIQVMRRQLALVVCVLSQGRDVDRFARVQAFLNGGLQCLRHHDGDKDGGSSARGMRAFASRHGGRETECTRCVECSKGGASIKAWQRIVGHFDRD